MTSWSFIAQRVLTGELLELDVPLKDVELSWALSGAGSLRGTVSPDTLRLRAADGKLLLEPWGTLVYAEADGLIRWGGIVIDSGFNGEDWSVECASFSTYPHGVPYSDYRTWIQADPVEPFKELWQNAQWRPNARLGVMVVADKTNVKIGYRGTTGDNKPISQGDIDSEKWAELIGLGWQERNAQLHPPARIFRNTVTAERWTELTTKLSWRAEEKPEGAAETWQPSWADPPLVEEDPEPFELAWWDSPDIGSKIDELAQSTPFDYQEFHFWAPETDTVDASVTNPDVVQWLISRGWYSKPTDRAEVLYRPDAGMSAADEVGHIVRVHYPRIGNRREDLKFVQGDNISEVVTPEFDGAEFANCIQGIGAGEGAATLRRETMVLDGRLFRPRLYTDKSAQHEFALNSKIDAELQRRRNLLTISEVTVRDHPNARIGSWTLGDDILVEADLPWLGEVELWCRIIGWSLVSDDTARLELQRSDTFKYGG